MLKAQNITVRYGNLTILNDVSFTLNEGEWLMVVGPNGAGKSTLVQALSQGAPYSGSVAVQGRDARRMRPYEFARQVGVLAQKHSVQYAFTVEEVVRLGRYAYSSGIIPTFHKDDPAVVESALSQTGLAALANQSVLTLSGGELQRVFLAQIWAQNPSVLLLDEPSNHLDLQYRQQTFDMILKWLREPNRAVLSVVHDLSLARAYGTHALVLNHGGTIAYGQVEETLTRDTLQSVYGMDVYAWMERMLAQWR
jgi:iron complex transport system ATP-binding protein